MFYAFVLIEPEILSHSEFIQHTCLSFGKVFQYINVLENNKKSEKEESVLWLDVLRIYLNVQTILLKCLKYNFIEKSILFVGSFYETLVQVTNIFLSFKIRTLI